MNQTYLAKLLWNIWMSLTVTFCCLKMVASHPFLLADPQEMYPIFGGPLHTTTTILRRKVLWFWGPTRASFTIWMYLHQAFSMVGCLWKWDVLESPVCPWCNDDVQINLHLFTGLSEIQGCLEYIITKWCAPKFVCRCWCYLVVL